MARQVLENGVVLPAEYSDDWYDDMTSNLTKLDDVIGSDSEKLSSADVGAAALSNNYNDLDNLPTIPTVNDATLTIQKNGVDVQTFTANASSNVTANITVPTKTSDITNDSNFVDTSNSAVASGITSAKVTDYDTHIADTDIHVTTADKNKWNNQTYVFRYSSTALTASSTNSNALLDNTDNLKIGDKVIDSSGVLFSITAIDTQNSTFTIGTALIDLAQDSDVVHKSGDETKSGKLTLSDTLNSSDIVPIANNSYSSGSSNNQWNNLYAKNYYYNGTAWGLDKYNIWTNSQVYKLTGTEVGSTTSGYISLSFIDKNNANLGFQRTSIYSDGRTCFSWKIYNTDNNSQPISSSLEYYITKTEVKVFAPVENGEVNLGTSTNKWKSFNGLEPSSLSLPSGNASDVIDISSYIVNLDGTTNSYTVPANGWISIAVVGTAIAIVSSSWSDSRLRASSGDVRMLYPVLKNETLDISVTGTTLDYARFIPCQGNV